MSDWLIQGDKIPPITLNTIDGKSISLPDAIEGRYLALLFYRGNW
jgi:peroxiredoxin